MQCGGGGPHATFPVPSSLGIISECRASTPQVSGADGQQML